MKILAMNVHGNLTWCPVGENIDKGRCDHIAHICEDENPQAFLERSLKIHNNLKLGESAQFLDVFDTGYVKRDTPIKHITRKNFESFLNRISLKLRTAELEKERRKFKISLLLRKDIDENLLKNFEESRFVKSNFGVVSRYKHYEEDILFLENLPVKMFEDFEAYCNNSKVKCTFI